MTRCTACGTRLIPVDGWPLLHPSCDGSPEALRMAAEAEARELKAAGMDQAAETSPDDFTVASAIIRAAALEMTTFSANDLRSRDTRWEQLGSKVRGAAMSHAARRRWAHKSGRREQSSSGPTHAHEIDIWISDIYIDELKVGLVTGRQGVA